MTLGPPAAGEFLIKALPAEGLLGYVAGMLALRPGAFIPRCRCLQTDEVWFVYKGQGRVTVGTQTATIVPGMVVHVPRATWHAFRNTGTGLLQLFFWAHPAGIEAFYREIAALGSEAASAAVAAAGQRYGIEFDAQPQANEPPQASDRHRRRRRRREPRRGVRPGAAAASSAVLVAPAVTPHVEVRAAAPSAVAAESALPAPRAAADRSRHRHRRRGPRRAVRPAAPMAPRAPALEASAPAAAAQPLPGGGAVKEVYMNGRWVRVSGEGPVIAPGRERRSPRGEHRRRPPRLA